MWHDYRYGSFCLHKRLSEYRVQLRTVPEVLEYLAAPRSLPASSLRVIGDELPLFELYPMNGGTTNSLSSCLGHTDAHYLKPVEVSPTPNLG
jgi:hypothetical protein